MTLTFAKAGTVETFLHIMPVGSMGPAAGGDTMNMNGGAMADGHGQMTGMRAIRILVWVAVVALVGTVGWIYFASQRGTVPGIVASQIGGPFTLTDQNGNTVTEAALQGHPSVMYFGYTYCPDVCPTTLADLTQWMSDLGADANKLKVYFITVDPERDTQDGDGVLHAGLRPALHRAHRHAGPRSTRSSRNTTSMRTRCRARTAATRWTTRPPCSCSIPRPSWCRPSTTRRRRTRRWPSSSA